MRGRRGSRSFLISMWLLPLAVGAAHGDSAPQVRFPDPDIGVDALAAREKAQRATVGQFKVFYDFQFTDRVKESGITFVHHVVDDAGMYYKPVHYDHGNGIAVADVDGDGLDRHLLRQPARRQRALEEPRRRQVQEHHAGGRRRAGRPDRRHRVVRRHRQRRRPGPVRHHGPRRQRAVRERRPRALQGHLEGGRRRLRRPLVGRGVLRLRQRRPARPVSSATSAGTRPTTRGAAAHYVGLTDAFSGHLHPDRVRDRASSTGTWAATGSRT